MKTYSVSKTKQLIDINGSLTNFECVFTVSAPKPFYMLIVDQSTLDSTEGGALSFKKVESSISGEVRADKNVYQNYFLILKADESVEVTVDLQVKPLPDYIEPPTEKVEEMGHETITSTDMSVVGMCLGFIVLVGILYIILNRTDSKVPSKSSITTPSLLEKLRKIPLD